MLGGWEDVIRLEWVGIEVSGENVYQQVMTFSWKLNFIYYEYEKFW